MTYFACRLVAPAMVFVWVISPATAQQAQSKADWTHDVQTYFYKDPRPERLVGFIATYDAATPTPQWGAYPPVAGLFAVVLRTHPTWIGKLVPARLNSKSADTVIAALQLSGQFQKAGPWMAAQIRQAGSDERLRSEFADLPTRLEDIRIQTPTHLDILWGASFASGDARFARMIADFSARTANRSEQAAVDVAQTALAIMGGPKDILGQLRGRHGDAVAREIVYAATALWALQSNARQHPFVDEAFTKYIQEHSGTLAAKAFSVVRFKKQK